MDAILRKIVKISKSSVVRSSFLLKKDLDSVGAYFCRCVDELGEIVEILSDRYVWRTEDRTRAVGSSDVKVVMNWTKKTAFNYCTSRALDCVATRRLLR